MQLVYSSSNMKNTVIFEIYDLENPILDTRIMYICRLKAITGSKGVMTSYLFMTSQDVKRCISRHIPHQRIGNIVYHWNLVFSYAERAVIQATWGAMWSGSFDNWLWRHHDVIYKKYGDFWNFHVGKHCNRIFSTLKNQLSPTDIPKTESWRHQCQYTWLWRHSDVIEEKYAHFRNPCTR